MKFEFDMTRKSIPQGDVYLIPIKMIPEEAVIIDPTDGVFIIAHSETGHSHVIKERPDIKQFSGMDMFQGFLEIGSDELTELIHLRSHHTHRAQPILPGAYLIQRQGRPTPEGWKRAVD
jgi:hypothetical protein